MDFPTITPLPVQFVRLNSSSLIKICKQSPTSIIVLSVVLHFINQGNKTVIQSILSRAKGNKFFNMNLHYVALREKGGE